MPRITEDLAGRYATAVVDVLAEHFPQLQDWRNRLMVIGQIGEHVEAPTRSFELCVNTTREWRLHPEDRSEDERRVRLGCHKDHWTEADVRFSDSINRKLRAIQLED